MRFMCRACCLLLSCVLCFGVFSEKFKIESSADILSTVTLTPEQTLALYGTEIPAVYRDGDTWKSCTFEFFSVGNFDSENPMPVDDFDLRASSFSGYNSTSDYINNNYRVRPRLYYVCKRSDAPISSNSDFEFSISPSVDISGIAYYRQSFSFTFWRGDNRRNARNNIYCATTVDYSPSPIISNVEGWDGYEYGYIITSYVGNNSTSQYHTYFDLIDVYLQNIVNGQEQTFSVSDQVLKFGRSTPVVIPPYDPNDLYYVLSVQCPTVTDGYVLPEPPIPEPNIPGQLTDIQTSIDASNTQLALILAKLDQIYNVNISPTINISSDSQSSLISGIVDGIRGLFVPTKAQLLAFRNNMEIELSSAFPSFYSANTAINNQYGVFHNVSAVSSIRFPGVSLDLPTGQGSQTANFNIAAQDVELKPASDRLGGLYDALAVIVDIICTLAVFNMLKKRFYRFFEGGASE